MPEGDTLQRIADRLQPAFLGKVIREARSRQDDVDVTDLIHSEVTVLEARGKHLVIGFRLQAGETRWMHNHLGMTGSWHLYRPGQTWSRPSRQAALALATDAHAAVCYNPKILELLSHDAYRRHPLLSRLGPDLLSDDCDFTEILRRFRRHPFAPLGVAVLDQTIASGLGNVYKSECLFLERLNPFTPVSQYSDQELLAFLERACFLMRRNLDGAARRTRFRGPGPRVWVYGRQDEPCLECGTVIAMRRQGDLARSTYYCPNCQATDGGLV